MKTTFRLILYLIGIAVFSAFSYAGGRYLQYRQIVKADRRFLPHASEAIPEAARPLHPLAKEVNPFIGTGGYPWVCGHNYPGASLPFGMVRLSPETIYMIRDRKAANTSGYHYRDHRMTGFSHTRLSGTGATDGGHFLVQPLNRDPEEHQTEHISRFSHRDEVAFPGYYAVALPDQQVIAELCATERTGIHRYTWSDPGEPHLMIDISNALGDHPSKDARVEIHSGSPEITGSVLTFGSFARRYGGIRVYFAARLDRDFEDFGIREGNAFRPGLRSAAGDDLRVELDFTAPDSLVAVQGFASTDTLVVELRLAISYVSIENARRNLEAETAGRSFEEILAAGQNAWEQKLSSIRITGGKPAQRSIFYTALYRCFQMPTVFQDVNGEYTGFDKQVHRAEGFRYYTDLSLWDTFRTLHPLYNLIAPAEQRDMMVSLVRMARQGGWLPRWPSGAGYTGSMLGTPADITLTDAWLKGIRDFDVEFAYRAMQRTALGPVPRGEGFSGRRGIVPYLDYGYCPADLMDDAVARTLEYAWADDAISRLAASLGKKEDAAMFRKHAGYYRNLWNPATGYFQPRNADGSFVEPFKPFLLTYFDRKQKYTNDYVEGSALQWRWAVPFDAGGLISLFGSREQFVSELNAFFEKADPTRGRWNPGAHYWHGNEPDIHAAYLFNEAGRPDLTQQWVRWILDHKYGTGHDGLDGNDDGATLSAWYIFSSLGFYPIAGTDIYQLGAPLFPKAEIDINGKALVVEAENHAPDNRYVKQVRLNGRVLERHRIRHDEIASGGRLVFEMTEVPSE